MKVRNGFVSNSSSSSFVILGITKPNSDQLKKFQSLYESYNEGETKTEYTVDDENGRYVGIVLGQASDGNTTEVSLSKINDIAVGLAALLEVQVSELKIIGTEAYS